MIYTIKHSDWQWIIEPSRTGKRFMLKYKRPMRWRQCKTFATAQAAADAVARGETGIAEWDSIRHVKPFPSFTAWLIDPTGTALSAFNDLLQGTILPPASEANKG
jgi:hypothetical protein